MARRTQSEEVNIGSDSFLDVIANMVGILIILIVIAGLRVSQAPASSPAPSPAASAEAAPDLTAAPEPDEEPEPASADLASRIPELEAEIQDLEREASVSSEALAELTSEREAEIQQAAAAQAELADHSSSLQQQRQQVRQLGETLDEKKRNLALLLKELRALQKTPPAVKKVKHTVTPMSRAVQGDEVHFRLEKNRVAVVPIKELIERLLKQAERQKDWLAKYHQHQGSVGPVGGFTMNYIVERQAMSPLDQYRGPGVFRVAVSAFKVVSEPDLKGETAREAARVGSDFHVALQTVKPGSTLTFWVYPDSFELYRELEELAHDAGFQVAARPLPFGVPIAGSPNGTRSAAQ